MGGGGSIRAANNSDSRMGSARMKTVNRGEQNNRCATGVPGLDDVLHGGLIPHRLYLLDGDPGAGKTTLAIQYLMEGVRRGEKCLYITLSETKDELTAGAKSHGWSLEGIEILELVVDDLELDGDAQVTMYPPSEVELGETTKKILAAVERTTPTADTSSPVHP